MAATVGQLIEFLSFFGPTSIRLRSRADRQAGRSMSTYSLAPFRLNLASLLQDARHVRSNPAWAFCGLTALGVLGGCLIMGTRFGLWSQAGKLLVACASMYLVVGVLIARKMLRLAMAIDSHIVISLTAFLSPFLICIVAMTAAPMRDQLLIEVDWMLGFSWLHVAYWFRDHPTISLVMCYAYLTIMFQTALLTFTLALVRPKHLRHCTSSLAVSLAVTTAIFPFVPAVGGYAHYGLSAKDFPDILATTAWTYPEVLVRVREGSIQILDSTCLEGLIAFPSFHAVTAVIYGYFWWQIPVARYAGVLLNGLMLISTIPVGSHYLTDVIGGVLVAAGSIWAMAIHHRNDEPVEVD